jgi:arylsulfatase A-like enzyme
VHARPEWKLDGVNLLPYLEGKNSGVPHRELFWRFGRLKAARIGDWKIVRTWDNNSLELYNLASDISEKHELSQQYPSQVKELEFQWEQWNAQLIPPLWPMPETDPVPTPKP